MMEFDVSQQIHHSGAPEIHWTMDITFRIV
jgi:hypothetical protein